MKQIFNETKVAKMKADKLTKTLKYCPSHNDRNTVLFTIFPLHGNFSISCPK